MSQTPDESRGPPVPRRHLLAGAGLLLLGGASGALLSRRFLPRAPLDADGLPTAEVDLGDARQLADRIEADGPVLVPARDGRLAVVRWDPEEGSGSVQALDRYGPGGEDHPVLDGSTGLMVLSLVSTHLGCLVGHCTSSHQFEDACHGSQWNAWGEYVGGPAPRGLDRFGSWVRDDGHLVVDLTRAIVGRRRDAIVLRQPPAGPSCLEV